MKRTLPSAAFSFDFDLDSRVPPPLSRPLREGGDYDLFGARRPSNLAAQLTSEHPA